MRSYSTAPNQVGARVPVAQSSWRRSPSRLLGGNTSQCHVFQQSLDALPRGSLTVSAAIKSPVRVPEIKERQTELSPTQLNQYFQRIELPEPLQNERRLGRLDRDLLKAIVKGHVLHIPFENLSLTLKKAKDADNDKISLDLQEVFNKLVLRKRGGYCFEQNTLLASVLTTMGFRLFTTAARSVPDGTPKKSREIVTNGIDHQVIIVFLDGQQYVVDAGFGAQTPKEPITLTESTLERFKSKSKGDHRLRKGHLGKKLGPDDKKDPAREGWYMQRLPRGDKTWTDIYFFTEKEFLPNDYSVANWFWSQNPDLTYRKTPLACIHTEEGRITLAGNRLRFFRDALVDEQTLDSEADIEKALSQHFGIEL